MSARIQDCSPEKKWKLIQGAIRKSCLSPRLGAPALLEFLETVRDSKGVGPVKLPDEIQGLPNRVTELEALVDAQAKAIDKLSEALSLVLAAETTVSTAAEATAAEATFVESANPFEESPETTATPAPKSTKKK